jgi:hypothetical protein
MQLVLIDAVCSLRGEPWVEGVAVVDAVSALLFHILPGEREPILHRHLLKALQICTILMDNG